MKVKNIMFSGFMAAVLAGACGAADAATVLASKEFVTTELGKKQNILQFDTTPTAMSENPVTSGGVAAALEDKADKTSVGNVPTGYDSIVEYVDAKTEGVDSTGAVSQLQTDVNAIEGKLAGLEEGKTVAEAIADAVYDDTALAGRVTANEGAITDLQNTKADKTELDGYVTTGTLTEYQGTISTALSGKASTGDVTALAGRVTTAESEIGTLKSEMDAVETKALANETAINNLDSTYAKDSEVTTAIAKLSQEGGAIATLTGTVAGIETELAGVKATANAAQTAEQVKNTVEGYGYQTADDVDTAISTAAITQSQVTGLTEALDGKVDDADLNNYYTKTDADAAFLEDAGLENGAAYLVTKDATTGKVVYQEVAVVASNGTDMLIGKAQ